MEMRCVSVQTFSGHPADMIRRSLCLCFKPCFAIWDWRLDAMGLEKWSTPLICSGGTVSSFRFMTAIEIILKSNTTRPHYVNWPSLLRNPLQVCGGLWFAVSSNPCRRSAYTNPLAAAQQKATVTNPSLSSPPGSFRILYLNT